MLAACWKPNLKRVRTPHIIVVVITTIADETFPNEFGRDLGKVIFAWLFNTNSSRISLSYTLKTWNDLK